MVQRDEITLHDDKYAPFNAILPLICIVQNGSQDHVQTVAFVASSMALVPESIWFGRPWSMTAKNFVDALIYALLTGGVFGWLV